MNTEIRKSAALVLALMSITAVGLATSPSSASAGYDRYYRYPADLDGDGDRYDAVVRWDGHRWRFDAPLYFATADNQGYWAVVFDHNGDGHHDHALFNHDGQRWNAVYSLYEPRVHCLRRSTAGVSIERAGYLWDASSCAFRGPDLTSPINRDGMQNLLLELASITGNGVGGSPSF